MKTCSLQSINKNANHYQINPDKIPPPSKIQYFIILKKLKRSWQFSDFISNYCTACTALIVIEKWAIWGEEYMRN